jgi:epoxyqueuosine reductase
LAVPFPAQKIKDRAQALGFNLVGLTPARPSPHLRAYLGWLEAGHQGEMDYMGRPDRVARRRDLNTILPGVRSLVIVGLDYHTLKLPDSLLSDPTRGRIAAYAWGEDYHRAMLPRLKALGAWLQAESGGAARHRAYVDTGAVLERSHGQQAGLGFTGKNTMLIHPRRGSDFFLGEVLTDVEFDAYDEPQREGLCGRCTRCLAACPTGAFPEPYVLDARRCISYLTIEQGGSIPPALRPLMGNWVFGCDVCQAVCPWGRFAVQTHETSFFPVSGERAAPPLARLLGLDEAAFAAEYGGTAVLRAGRDQMVRNACVAAANGRQRECAPLLRALTADRSAVVPEHANWALENLN